VENSQGQLKVKAVVVTMFDEGDDVIAGPGEFKLWCDRENLTIVYPLPCAFHDVFANEQGLIATVTGIGTAKAAASIMALGLDPRFDLTKAYWLVAGISGIDPEDASLGSAAWAEWVVDGDLACEIDAREIPPDWSTGYFPRGSKAPNTKPVGKGDENVIYRLNPHLVEWAYQLTETVDLGDSPEMAAYRANYTAYPNAQKPPFVLKGDTMASSTLWHGKLLNNWANDWMKLWSDGRGNFVTCAMEDTGTLQSLTFLAKANKVDLNRVMVLRTGSNYSMQATNMTAVESLNYETSTMLYPGLVPSLEAAYKVGSVVIHEIINHWEQYEQTVPGELAPSN